MALDLLSCVPEGWTPRPIQLEIFKEFQKGLEEGKEFFFINAPTGCGKSLVNITVANYLGSAYIMTPLKSLQKQYMKDFDRWVVEVKGRGNYRCPDGTPCNKGICVQDKKPPRAYVGICGKCEWLEVLEAGKASPLTLFNFYSYICQTKFARRFTDQRGAVIVDEAHNLIETLRTIFDINIQTDSLEAKAIKLPPALNDMDRLQSWIEDEGLEKVSTLAQLAPEDDESNIFRDLQFKFESLLQDPGNYVLGGTQKKYMVRRKRVGEFFQKYLNPHGQIKIFSSATLFQPKTICDYLSIPWEKVCYISLPWPMSEDQGPIAAHLAVSNITHKTLRNEKTIKQLAESVQTILEEIHPEEKGVVHCVSYSLKERLLEYLPLSVRIRMTDDLEEFKRSRNKVLIGPAFYEGLDLFDDLCRFQILLKIPLPSVMDPLVKHLGYDHPEIIARVVTSIAQAYGRGIRSEDDYCVFYILDRMITSWRRYLPDYMKRAFL